MNETIARAREIIGALTPLNSDCGARCGGTCCQPDEDGNGGVYLFPGEDAAEMVWGERGRIFVGTGNERRIWRNADLRCDV